MLRLAERGGWQRGGGLTTTLPKRIQSPLCSTNVDILTRNHHHPSHAPSTSSPSTKSSCSNSSRYQQHLTTSINPTSISSQFLFQQPASLSSLPTSAMVRLSFLPLLQLLLLPFLTSSFLPPAPAFKSRASSPPLPLRAVDPYAAQVDVGSLTSFSFIAASFGWLRWRFVDYARKVDEVKEAEDRLREARLESFQPGGGKGGGGASVGDLELNVSRLRSDVEEAKSVNFFGLEIGRIAFPGPGVTNPGSVAREEEKEEQLELKKQPLLPIILSTVILVPLAALLVLLSEDPISNTHNDIFAPKSQVEIMLDKGEAYVDSLEQSGREQQEQGGEGNEGGG